MAKRDTRRLIDLPRLFRMPVITRVQDVWPITTTKERECHATRAWPRTYITKRQEPETKKLKRS